MWRITAVALLMLIAGSPALAQDTATPTPPALVITVIVVPASATPTYTPTATLTETPGPSPTPTPTPSATPQSGLAIEQRDETTGSGVAGRVEFTVTAGEFMLAVLLFALLCAQVISWVLKMRGM
jgi:hypothetical protein